MIHIEIARQERIQSVRDGRKCSRSEVLVFRAARGTKTDEQRDQLEITGFDVVCTAAAPPPTTRRANFLRGIAAGWRREAWKRKRRSELDLFRKKEDREAALEWPARSD